MSNHRHVLRFLGLAAFVLAACSDPPVSSELEPSLPNPVSMVIEPGAALLPGAGSTLELRAVGYDAAGDPVAIENVTWTPLGS